MRLRECGRSLGPGDPVQGDPQEDAREPEAQGDAQERLHVSGTQLARRSDRFRWKRSRFGRHIRLTLAAPDEALDLVAGDVVRNLTRRMLHEVRRHAEQWAA